VKTICSICFGITKITKEKGLSSHAVCRGCVPGYAQANGLGDFIDELVACAKPVIARREEKTCPANR